MKIKSQTLMVNISNNVVFEKAGISLKAIHQVIIYEGDEGEILNDFELIDYENVTYLGMPIEGYKGVDKLRTQLKGWGIDFDEMVAKAVEEVDFSKIINELKEKFKIIIS
jgi:lipopolysaccharide export system protein LptA